MYHARQVTTETLIIILSIFLAKLKGELRHALLKILC